MFITKSVEYTSSKVTVVAASCDDCKKRIDSNWGPFVINSGTNHEPFSNILSLTVNTGYVSLHTGPSVEILLCSECANRLLDAFPYFRSIMKNPAPEQIL